VGIIIDKRPVFSVLMANRNYGHFIEEALDSILQQTFPAREIEIIVIDDGSTDDSREKLKKYEDRVTCIYKENGGQAAAFNRGVAVSKGEFVAFLDADDYWHSQKLQQVFEEFRKSDSVDFVYHYMAVINNDHHLIDWYIYPVPSSEEGTQSGKRYLNSYLSGTLPWFAPTSGMTIRAECLKKAIPWPEDLRAPDVYLHYVLPFYTRELRLIKKPLGYYRLHGNNISGGNLLTVRKLSHAINNIVMVEKHVEAHAERLGYDSSLIKKRIEAEVAMYKILIHGLEKRKVRALKDALLFKDFLPTDGFLYRVLRKSAMVVNILLPPAVTLWIQRKYRSILYLVRWELGK